MKLWDSTFLFSMVHKFWCLKELLDSLKINNHNYPYYFSWDTIKMVWYYITYTPLKVYYTYIYLYYLTLSFSLIFWWSYNVEDILLIFLRLLFISALIRLHYFWFCNLMILTIQENRLTHKKDLEPNVEHEKESAK